MARKNRIQNQTKPLNLSSSLSNIFDEEIKPEEVNPANTVEETKENVSEDSVIKEDKKERTSSSPEKKVAANDETRKEELLPKENNNEITNISPFARKKLHADNNISRSVTLEPLISDKLDFLVTDPKTGKKLKGSKGILKQVVNNALKKELVDMGVLDKSILETLEDYYE